jgi:hypothetical protein
MNLAQVGYFLSNNPHCEMAAAAAPHTHELRMRVDKELFEVRSAVGAPPPTYCWCVRLVRVIVAHMCFAPRMRRTGADASSPQATVESRQPWRGRPPAPETAAVGAKRHNVRRRCQIRQGTRADRHLWSSCNEAGLGRNEAAKRHTEVRRCRTPRRRRCSPVAFFAPHEARCSCGKWEPRRFFVPVVPVSLCIL